MPSLRFSFLVAGCCLAGLSGPAMAVFNDMDCLGGNFSTEVKHRGPPFGLSENILRVSKNSCTITVQRERFKFLKKQWTIDVCRGPVHIKAGAGSIEVFKREVACSMESKSTDFCLNMNEIFNVLQDDGLIFAEGEKEELESDHGKVYCSFLLIKKYLDDGNILGRHNHYENFIIRNSSGQQVVTPPTAPATDSATESSQAPAETPQSSHHNTSEQAAPSNESAHTPASVQVSTPAESSVPGQTGHADTNSIRRQALKGEH